MIPGPLDRLAEPTPTHLAAEAQAGAGGLEPSPAARTTEVFCSFIRTVPTLGPCTCPMAGLGWLALREGKNPVTQQEKLFEHPMPWSVALTVRTLPGTPFLMAKITPADLIPCPTAMQAPARG